MKRFILDTNILLDIFVFEDIKAQDLKQVIIDRRIEVISSQQTMAEFADVISRPIFALSLHQQKEIQKQWELLSQFYDDSNLASAPWNCADVDDQIFLNLAFVLKPTTLITKDNDLLKIASRAAKEDVVITSNYDIFNTQTENTQENHE